MTKSTQPILPEALLSFWDEISPVFIHFSDCNIFGFHKTCLDLAVMYISYVCNPWFVLTFVVVGLLLCVCVCVHAYVCACVCVRVCTCAVFPWTFRKLYKPSHHRHSMNCWSLDSQQITRPVPTPSSLCS